MFLGLIFAFLHNRYRRHCSLAYESAWRQNTQPRVARCSGSNSRCRESASSATQVNSGDLEARTVVGSGSMPSMNPACQSRSAWCGFDPDLRRRR
jgi:hypothetical protein